MKSKILILTVIVLALISALGLTAYAEDEQYDVTQSEETVSSLLDEYELQSEPEPPDDIVPDPDELPPVISDDKVYLPTGISSDVSSIIGVEPSGININGLVVNVTTNDFGSYLHVNILLHNALDIDVVDWTVTLKADKGAINGQFAVDCAVAVQTNGSVTVTPSNNAHIPAGGSITVWFTLSGTKTAIETSCTAELADGSTLVVFDVRDEYTDFNLEVLAEYLGVIIQNQEIQITELRETNERLAVQNDFYVQFWWMFVVLLVCKFLHFLFFRVFFGGLT